MMIPSCHPFLTVFRLRTGLANRSAWSRAEDEWKIVRESAVIIKISKSHSPIFLVISRRMRLVSSKHQHYGARCSASFCCPYPQCTSSRSSLCWHPSWVHYPQVLTFSIIEASWKLEDLQGQADGSLPRASVIVQSFAHLPWRRTDLDPDLQLSHVSMLVVLLGKWRYSLLWFEEVMPVASEDLFKTSSFLARVRCMQKQLVTIFVTGCSEYLMIFPLLLLICFFSCLCPFWDVSHFSEPKRTYWC